MSSRLFWWVILIVGAIAACDQRTQSKPKRLTNVNNLPPDQRDAHILGREIFELVDRALDYRGSHRGRPAANFRQMGIESLSTLTVRRLENVQRDPVVTVAFRQGAGRQILSCRGDSRILEEAAVKGRFTIMCTASSGAQLPMEVGETSSSE